MDSCMTKKFNAAKNVDSHCGVPIWIYLIYEPLLTIVDHLYVRYGTGMTTAVVVLSLLLKPRPDDVQSSGFLVIDGAEQCLRMVRHG